MFTKELTIEELTELHDALVSVRRLSRRCGLYIVMARALSSMALVEAEVSRVRLEAVARGQLRLVPGETHGAPGAPRGL